MEMADVIIGLLSGIGGTGAGTMLGKVMLDRFVSKYDDLAKKVQRLEEERIKGIENRVVKVEDSCQAHKINQDLTRNAEALQNLLGWMKKNDLVLAEIRDAVRSLEAHRKDDREYLNGLNADVKDHVSDHSIHEVHRG